MSSDEVLMLDRVPARIAVIGGGAIGCEFASTFADLGATVTILEGLPKILPGLDEDVANVVVRSFRKKLQFIRAATDEREFYAMKSLHFEKLQGKRAHQHSMRLNKQWRLVIEFGKSESGKIVVVVSVEDYH